MSCSIKNLKSNSCIQLIQPIIKEKYIKLNFKKEKSYNEIHALNNISNQNNDSSYYSNVIKRQNSNSANRSSLIHEFLDNKKIIYKDITNKIDKDELSSKIKNIVINTQRFKSLNKIKNNDENQTKICQRKTNSCRQSNSSFTTDNESKNISTTNNAYKNYNNLSTRKVQNYNNNFSFNLNLYNYINNSVKKNNNNIKENVSYNNDKYDTKTLKEYLNEQVNKIKLKRRVDEFNIRNIKNNNNYSMDNKNMDNNNNTENISNNIDNLIVLSNKNKNIISNKFKNIGKILNILNNNQEKLNAKKKIEEKINSFYDKTNNYISYTQNYLKRKNKINNNYNNTFKNSHLNINLTQNKTLKNLENNKTNKNNNNIKSLKFYCKENIFSKPIKPNINIDINDNNKSNNLNKICETLTMTNIKIVQNCQESKENKNTNNICITFNKDENSQMNDLWKNESKDLENVDKIINNKNFKKRKYYSEMVRNKIYSNSQRKFKK